jgi:hypothetical protein
MNRHGFGSGGKPPGVRGRNQGIVGTGVGSGSGAGTGLGAGGSGFPPGPQPWSSMYLFTQFQNLNPWLPLGNATSEQYSRASIFTCLQRCSSLFGQESPLDVFFCGKSCCAVLEGSSTRGSTRLIGFPPTYAYVLTPPPSPIGSDSKYSPSDASSPYKKAFF